MDGSVAAFDSCGKRTPVTALTPIEASDLQTTFFASTDGLLLSIVGAYHHDSNIAENLIHASLAGALAFHVSAGSFRPNIHPGL